MNGVRKIRVFLIASGILLLSLKTANANVYIGKDTIGVGTPSPSTAVQVVGTVTATTFSGNGAGLAGIVTAIGTCATASDIAAKTVAVSNFSLVAGVNVLVIFTSSNSAASPTLNVNSTGDIAIYHEDGNAASATYPAYFPAGAEIEFYYDGAYWRFKQRVVTNYISGARWYRVYSDGWIEQGDSASTLDTAITFSKPFRDTNYTLLNVSFVIANYGAQYVVKYVSYFTTWSAVNTAGTYSWEAKGY